MTKFTVQHVFHTDAATFWERVFFNPAYNERLYTEGLGFGYSLLDQQDLGGGVRTRKVKTEPKADVPAAMKKIIGDSLYYVEEGRFDPAKQRWLYTVTTSKMSDKVDIHGEYWIVHKGDQQLERFCSVTIDVKVFGVGKMVEGFVEKSTRDNYDKAAVFTNKWLAEGR